MRVELSRFTGRRSIGANEPFVVFAGILGLAPRSGEFYTGHDGDGQSRADATAPAAPRIHPRFRSARLIPCRAVNPNPLEAASIIAISTRLGWVHESIYLSNHVVQDTHTPKSLHSNNPKLGGQTMA